MNFTNLIKSFFKHVLYGLLVINVVIIIQGYIMTATIDDPSLTSDYIEDILASDNYNQIKIGKEFSIADKNFGFIITFNPSNYGLLNRNCSQDTGDSLISD